MHFPPPFFTARYRATRELKVATESTAWRDYWTKVASLVAGGHAPDVLQMDYRYLVEYAKRGTLLPLFAMSVLSLVPLFVIVRFCQRFLIQGIAMSGLKR